MVRHWRSRILRPIRALVFSSSRGTAHLTSDGLLNEVFKYRAFPGMIRHRVLRFWPTLLPLPQAGYSLIADHSGLCLDVLNSSTDNAVAVQQLPLNRGKNQLWGFAPDNEGFNFIINLHSGEVLEVAEIKNCAPVRQYPFNGGDNQRWQLFH